MTKKKVKTTTVGKTTRAATGYLRDLKKKTPPPARVPPNITLEIPKDFPKDWGKVDGKPFGYPSGVDYSGITGSQFKSPQEFGAAFENLKHHQDNMDELAGLKRYLFQVSQRISRNDVLFHFVEAATAKAAVEHYKESRLLYHPDVKVDNDIDVTKIQDMKAQSFNGSLTVGHRVIAYPIPTLWRRFCDWLDDKFWDRSDLED